MAVDAPAPAEWILLTGRRHGDHDGVADYCGNLAEALAATGKTVRLAALGWTEGGWTLATERFLRHHPEQAAAGAWVLVQYTAHAWSRRGVPRRLPGVVRRLQVAGFRVAVVFHDKDGYPGTRLRDRLRRWLQRRVMVRLARRADAALLTVHREQAPWTRRLDRELPTIPVGSNIPIGAARAELPPVTENGPRVVVFGLAAGDRGAEQARTVVRVLAAAAREAGPLQLVAVGRGTAEHQPILRDGLRGAPVQVRSLGTVSATEIAAELAEAHIMLWCRAPLTTNRGSAVAGLAAGLALVAWADEPLAAEFGEAVTAAPSGDEAALAGALAEVAADKQRLAERGAAGRRAYEASFTWAGIATAYGDCLRGGA